MDVLKRFYPIKMLSLVIINAKSIMQNLWQIKVSWDELLPRNIETEWRNFAENMPLINNILIPRKLFPNNRHVAKGWPGMANPPQTTPLYY